MVVYQPLMFVDAFFLRLIVHAFIPPPPFLDFSPPLFLYISAYFPALPATTYPLLFKSQFPPLFFHFFFSL